MANALGRAPGEPIISPAAISALQRDAASIRAEIAALSAQIEDHEAKTDRLRTRRAALEDGVAKIDSLILATTSSSASIDARGGSVKMDTAGIRAVAARGGPATLVDQIEAAMRKAAEPLHYRDLLDRLHSDGIDIGGKEPAATLLSVLANKRYESRFARAGRGVYMLADGSQAHAPRPRASKRRRRRIRSAGKVG